MVRLVSFPHLRRQSLLIKGRNVYHGMGLHKLYNAVKHYAVNKSPHKMPIHLLKLEESQQKGEGFKREYIAAKNRMSPLKYKF